MATVTGLTADRMLAIEAQSIVDGTVDENGHLQLTTHGGAVIDAGKVKGDAGGAGEAGPVGPVTQPAPEPIAPSALSVVSNVAFHTPAQAPMATVKFQWNVVLLDIIGDTPAIDEYELWHREVMETTWTKLATSEDNKATVTTLEPGVQFQVKVRAHTYRGGWGAFSTPITVTPAVPASDVPKTPANVAITVNTGSYAADGRAEATIKLNWDNVTLSVDSAPIGIRTYEVWLEVEGNVSPILTTAVSEVFLKYPSGYDVSLAVRAMSNFGVWSALSAFDSVTTAFPPQNNTPASMPVLTSTMGIVTAFWDGELESGPAGPEFQHLITEVATSSTGPWNAVGIPAVSEGQAAALSIPVGTQIWVRYRWRDRIGRLSGGISDVATITSLGIAHEDLSDDLANAMLSIENAVVSIVTEYSVNSSETVAPTTGWSTAAPARTPGSYIWMRTTTTYGDESVVVSSPAQITGNAGASGSTGAAGKGISGTVVTYQVHTNGTTAPTGTWVASPPATTTGQFLWTRTVTTYTDTTTTTGYSVSAHGATGATGSPGIGITSTAITYQAHTNGTTAPTGTWASTPPVVPAGQYLWTKTYITYSDASNTTSYAVSRQGSDGATGTTGANGQTSYLHVAYATNATGTTGFSTTDPSNKTYMGTYTDFTAVDSTNAALYDWVKIEGPVGSTGPTGKGISSSAVHYQGSTSGTVVPTGTWVTSVPVIAAGEYLWTRTTITFTDAATQLSYSTSRQGVDGPQGIQGPAGPNGQTLYTWIKYSDTPTTGMADSPVGKTYMGIAYNKVSATESSVYGDYEWSVIVGPQGSQGPVGPNGAPTYTWVKYGSSSAGAGLTDDPTNMSYMGIAYNKSTATESTVATDYSWSLIQGAAGRGISSTAVTYQVHTNGTTAPTGTWLASPAATTTGQFLWTRTVTTYTDATNSTAYSVSAHGATGSTGSTGAAGKGIAATTVTYQVHSSGTVAPTGTWTATPGVTSPGQFLWTRTVIDYTDTTSVTVYGVSAHGATGATGSTGGTGAAGADATNVVVGNDAVAIPTDPAGATTTTHIITIPFSGWIGNARAAATIAATGLPTGITAGTNTAATTGADGSLILNVASASTLGGTTLGEITLTITCNSKTFVKKFTWSKAPQGATGSTGSTGSAGSTGTPGTSATSIDIGNEAVVIPATSAGLTTAASTITIPFTGYLGNTRVATTVAVSGLPTGITVQTNTAGTAGADGSLILAVASGSSLGGTDFGNITLTVTANAIPFVQTLTWSKALAGATGSTGSTGGTGAAGADATNVVVGNDAVAIPTDNAGTTTTTHVLTIPFSGWIGNARAAATVVASGLPTGITAGTNTAATTGADGSLLLNVASASTLGGTSLGEITLTITCNSKTFVKKFTWSKAPSGATGSTGGTGAAGKGISSTVVTYQADASGTVAPVGTWVAAPPAVTPGQYLWTRTVITYTDATSSTGYSVALQGATGATGSTGSTGSTGAAGRGITTTVVNYQADASGTVVPVGTWVTSPPATTPGQYLWTRTVITYTDATNSTSYAISKHGDTGVAGTPGTSATSIDVGNEAVVIPATSAGATVGASSITIPFTGYIGTTRAAATVVVSGLPTGITVTTNTAGTTSAAGSLVLAVAAASTLGGTNDGNITLTITCNSVVFVQTFTWSKAIAGAPGSTGGTGAAGVDATNVVVGNDATAIPTDPSGTTTTTAVITIPFSGWIGNARAAATIAASGLPTGITAGTNTAATTGADGSLILNVASASTLGGTAFGEITLTITCNSKTFVKKFSWSKAPSGATGSTGSTGSTGAAGRGISSTVVDYQASASGTVAPVSTWVASPPAVTPGQFLWTRTVITYTDASSTTGYAVALQGATGATGSTGSTGGTGPAGKGISTTVVNYQADASGTVIPVGTWVTSPPATTPGQYLWTRTVITYTDATSSTSYAISKHGDTGSTGSAGAPATSIDVGNEAVVIVTNSAGATTGASTITVPFTGYIGAARAAATVVVSGLPTGITVQTNTAGTTGAAGSLILAVASASTLGGTDTGNITLTITCNSLTFVQTLSWAKALAGAAGGTGAAGADATYVTLGNDAVSIPTDATGTTASTFALTVPFAGYIGNARAAATIAATGLPSGITAGTNTAATSSADGSLILNVASASTLGGTSSGEITLTITCNSKTFAYKFSWAKAPAGAAGGTGSAGVSATSVDIGNEAVVVPCNAAGVTLGASTITIPFTGFIGATRAAATVVATTLPTGITVQTNTPGTTGAAGTLILAVAAGSNLGGGTTGDITLTVTVNSIAFVQLFSWSKGTAGNGIVSAVNTYQTKNPNVNPTLTEIRRNLFVDPRAKSLTNFASTSGTLSLVAYAGPTVTAVRCTVNTAVAARLFEIKTGVNTPNAGQSIRLRARVNCSVPVSMAVTVRAVNGSGTLGPTTATSLGTYSAPAGESFLDLTGVTLNGATLVSTSAIVIVSTAAIGTVVDITEVQVEYASSASKGGGGYFDGATVPSAVSGLVAAWSGTADASQSTLSETGYTVAPTGTWSSTIPTFNPGDYLWTKTVTTFTDSTSTTTYQYTLQGGRGVSSVTPYYLQQGTGVAAPAAPTANPPGGSWSLTEPAYISSTELYRADLFVFTDATFGWTSVSKVSAYTAATSAVNVANIAQQAANGMVKASQTDPGHDVGRIWFVLNGTGEVIGMKISNGSTWSNYVIMADQILVPGSVGTTSITGEAITGEKLDVTSIWADIAWLTEIRTGKIEASMVSSKFAEELTLESNAGINIIITKQGDQATLLDNQADAIAAANTEIGKVDTKAGAAASAATTATTNAAAAKTLATAVQTDLQETRTWFRVDNTGAHLGSDESDFQAHILPGEFNITDSGTVTSQWTAQRFVAPVVQAQKEVLLSKHSIQRYPAFPAAVTGTVIRVI